MKMCEGNAECGTSCIQQMPGPTEQLGLLFSKEHMVLGEATFSTGALNFSVLAPPLFLKAQFMGNWSASPGPEHFWFEVMRSTVNVNS